MNTRSSELGVQTRNCAIRIGMMAVVALMVGATTTLATLPVTSGDIVFSDEFNDNSSGWSNIGAGSGQATIGLDPGGTGATVWYPSVGGVFSRLTLAQDIDISDAPIAIYMRVRVDDTAGGSANRFDIALTEKSPDNRLGLLQIRPGQGGDIGRRDSGGAFQSTSVGNVFNHPNTTTFVDYQLLFTDNNDGSMTLQAFTYDLNISAYKLMGTVTGDLDSGVFNLLEIEAANSGGNNRVYFDSVAVAVIIPEPSSLALGISVLPFAAWFGRRKARVAVRSGCAGR